MATGTEVVPIPLVAAGGNRVLYGRHCRLHGFTVQETSQVAGAFFDLVDGGVTSPVIALTLSIAAQESVRDWFGEGGIVLRGGLSIVSLSGAFKGSVFVSALAGDVAADLFYPSADA